MNAGAAATRGHVLLFLHADTRLPATAFGDIAPVSVVDISLHGARMHVRSRIPTGTGGPLRFQVDEQTGLTDVFGRVMWCAPSRDEGGFVAGLKIFKWY